MSDTNQSNGALPVRSMDEILAELDKRGQPEAVDVPCPELGSLFRVRGLTRAELMHMNTIATRKGVTNQGMLDEMSLTTGVVEPKITVEQYRRLRHRADANPAIQRLQTKIAELTSGEPVEGPDGQEVDAVDAAYFPATRDTAAAPTR
jgi:hypothetical protein